jgi:hypothetical protein
MRLHILYTDKNREFQETYKEFSGILEAEEWLTSSGALYWEIGINDYNLKDNRDVIDTDCMGNCFTDADPGL